MKVDIWSDIRCPFCYIGKRKFEHALEQFTNKDKVEVTWHSFQLDPNLKTQPEVDLIDHFTKAKGISREQALQMFSRAKEMAVDTGLEFDMDSLIVANSFQSHQLLQFAKTKGLGDEIKEVLFEAHFRDAKNIDDRISLLELAESVGLDRTETEEALTSQKFAVQVKQDEQAAKTIGVTGVPFFVFDNKYAVSGAQAPETFLEVLEKCLEGQKAS